MPDQEFIIALDGLAAAGKSTLAQKIAAYFHLAHLDSGALYRYVALYFLKKGLNFKDSHELKTALESLSFDLRNSSLYLDGENISDELRSLNVEEIVSEIAAIPAVREKINRFIRNYSRCKKIIVEGRDIGSVVFPKAQLKIFLTARADIRIERRLKQAGELGQESEPKTLRKRDALDSSRKVAPASPAPDALLIDTTDMSLEEVTTLVLRLVEEKLHVAESSDPRSS